MPKKKIPSMEELEKEFSLIVTDQSKDLKLHNKLAREFMEVSSRIDERKKRILAILLHKHSHSISW